MFVKFLAMLATLLHKAIVSKDATLHEEPPVLTFFAEEEEAPFGFEGMQEFVIFFSAVFALLLLAVLIVDKEALRLHMRTTSYAFVIRFCEFFGFFTMDGQRHLNPGGEGTSAGPIVVQSTTNEPHPKVVANKKWIMLITACLYVLQFGFYVIGLIYFVG